MAHTNSKTWMSPEMVELERWELVKKNLERMRFDRSPFIPADFADWLEHRAAYAVITAVEEKRRLAQREAMDAVGFGPSQYKIVPAYGGRVFRDNRSATLAQETVWSPWYEPTEDRQLAPWPARDEFKEEGDERHTSGFGRFLPIPRVPGNETVVWKQKAFVPTSPMDQVSPVPTYSWMPFRTDSTLMRTGISVSSDEIAEKYEEGEDEASTVREEITEFARVDSEMTNDPPAYEVTVNNPATGMEQEMMFKGKDAFHNDKIEDSIPMSLLALYNQRTMARKASMKKRNLPIIGITETPISLAYPEDQRQGTLKGLAIDMGGNEVDKITATIFRSTSKKVYKGA